jgi:hypothetical protein
MGRSFSTGRGIVAWRLTEKSLITINNFMLSPGVTSMAQYDTGYRLLFSHPEMVRDLLLGYVPAEWVAEADFSTLEHVNGSYVADSERQRHSDQRHHGG